MTITDAQEPFAVRLWRMGVGRALPIDPATDNIPMTATQLREFQEQAHVDALIYTSGYREGLEAAAAWLDSQMLTDDELREDFGFTTDYPAVAAAAIRDMATDK